MAFVAQLVELGQMKFHLFMRQIFQPDKDLTDFYAFGWIIITQIPIYLGCQRDDKMFLAQRALAYKVFTEQ